MSAWHKAVFGISPDEVLVSRRGFSVADSTVKIRIEQIGAAFVQGYHAALLDNEWGRLSQVLNQAPVELRGFVYEGAAMGLAIVDFFAPWRQPRWRQLAEAEARSYIFLMYVGAGWALARLPVPINFMLKPADPVLRWLMLDGFGFHEGYFHARQTIAAQLYPRRINGYARQAFDQGVGRSLWFVLGADSQRIADQIGQFSMQRQGDLWSGVGLAAGYAGGVSVSQLQHLNHSSAAFQPQLAQGVAFAAKARIQADNLAEQTELACQVICQASVGQVVQWVDLAYQDLPNDTAQLTAYEVWRRRVQQHFQ